MALITFASVEAASSFIASHNASASRKEKDINEVIWFGMGCVYAYRKEAAAAGLCAYDYSSAFYYFNSEEEIEIMLAWLQDNDGYLYAA